MNLSELSNLKPSASYLRDVADVSEQFYFSSHNKQVTIIHNRSGYHLCTFNCSLVRNNYPIDRWQVDCSNNSLIMIVHYFRCLIINLIPFARINSTIENDEFVRLFSSERTEKCASDSAQGDIYGV